MGIFLSEKMVQAMGRGLNGPRKLSSEDFQSFLTPFISLPIKAKQTMQNIQEVSPEESARTGKLEITHDDEEPRLD